MKFLQLLGVCLVGGPANDEALIIGGARFGDNVEVYVRNFLVRNFAVVLSQAKV